MNDQAVTQPGTVALEPPSTVLNPQTVPVTSGGGAPSVSDVPGDDGSVESVLEAELARLKSEDKPEPAKAEAKPEAKEDDKKPEPAKESKADDKKDAKEEKPARQRGDDGKFAKTEKPEQDEVKADKGVPEKAATERGPDDRQSEGRKHTEPPARFLPEARTKWANTPNEVKAEVHRVAKEYESEIAQSRPVIERYNQLREFDDLARSNGRDLRESLIKINEIENSLQRNPIGALNEILREVGPRKADGSPLSIYEVVNFIQQQTPEQLARLTQSAPTQQMQSHQQPGARDPEYDRLLQENQALKAERTIVPTVQAFASSRPDFETLAPQIEAIFASGVIENIYGPGLSLEQKLSEAYRMAGGSVSPSQSEPEVSSAHSEASPRPVNLDAGKKSIRGAPSDGADTEVEEPDSDLATMLRKELRRMSA